MSKSPCWEGIVTFDVSLGDSLEAQGFNDDVRSRLTAAEILTVGIVAARYFHNHHKRALCVLIQLGYIPPLSVSRFNRRLHYLSGWCRRLCVYLREQVASQALYFVDVFPLPVCKRVRMNRCCKVKGEAYLGYCEAKREWFFGYKLHWCCNADGVPVAFTLRPARRHERTAVSILLARLPAPATIP